MSINIPPGTHIVHDSNTVRIYLNDREAAKVLYDELKEKSKQDVAQSIYREVVANLRTELQMRDTKVWNEAIVALGDALFNCRRWSPAVIQDIERCMAKVKKP